MVAGAVDVLLHLIIFTIDSFLEEKEGEVSNV